MIYRLKNTKCKYTYRALYFLLAIFLIIGCDNKKCEKIFFSDGKLKQEICEEKEGTLFKRAYNEDGSLQGEGFFDKDGKKQGVYKEYFSNGKIKGEAQFKNDSLNGLVKFFFESGSIDQEGLYKGDKRNGYYKSYYENSILKLDAICENGITLYYKEYDMNGLLTGEYHSVKIISVKGDTINKAESYKAKVILIGPLEKNEKIEINAWVIGPGLTSTKELLEVNNQEIIYESQKLNVSGEYVFEIFATIKGSVSKESRKLYVK